MTSHARVLVCNMNAFTPAQRARHAEATKRLLACAIRSETADGYVFSVLRDDFGVAELAEWVARESRCCPAVDFSLDLPAFRSLSLRISGGADVKAFMKAELNL